MAVLNLNARKRDDIASSSLKTSRKKGSIPGVFYRRDIPSVPLYVKDAALKPFIYTSEVNIINLKIEGTNDSYSCILKDVQFDPVTDVPIHFDLLGISENEKIKLEVPITLIGSPVGVKEGGILQHSVHKVDVECLPKNIPSHIEVNIENLNIGDSIHVGELEVKDFEILDSPDTTIVAVVPPTVEKVEAPLVEGEEGAEAEAAEGEEKAEPEVISKGKKEEEEKEEEKGKEKEKEK
jgi:large subunit ribosomal protein L25